MDPLNIEREVIGAQGVGRDLAGFEASKTEADKQQVSNAVMRELCMLRITGVFYTSSPSEIIDFLATSARHHAAERPSLLAVNLPPTRHGCLHYAMEQDAFKAEIEMETLL